MGSHKVMSKCILVFDKFSATNMLINTDKVSYMPADRITHRSRKSLPEEIISISIIALFIFFLDILLLLLCNYNKFH